MLTWMWTQLKRLVKRDPPPLVNRVKSVTVTYVPGGAKVFMQMEPQPGDRLCWPVGPYWTDDS